MSQFDRDKLRHITITVNGVRREAHVPSRKLLSDVIREDFQLTGTHVGCEHGACGACTVLLDGEAVRSCTVFAVQADGSELITIEGIAGEEGIHLLQQSFIDSHGLQCGYCTSGMILTIVDFLRSNPRPTEAEVAAAISGNLCRCTGYKNIIDAVMLAAPLLSQKSTD